MAIKIKHRPKKYQIVYDNMSTPKSLLNKLILHTKDQTIKRTKRGVDVDGNKFKPYSSQYKKQKSENGRSGSVVNLTLTGSLLSNIGTSSSNTISKCYTKDKTGYYIQNGVGNQPERKWFGFSNDLLSSIRLIVNKSIKFKGTGKI